MLGESVGCRHHRARRDSLPPAAVARNPVNRKPPRAAIAFLKPAQQSLGAGAEKPIDHKIWNGNLPVVAVVQQTLENGNFNGAAAVAQGDPENATSDECCNEMRQQE